MNPTNPISEKSIGQLLAAYYENSLTDSEKEILEKNAETDSFLSEAMEGFQDFPDAVLEIPEFKTGKSFNWKWLKTTALVVLTTTIVFFLFPSESQPEKEIAENKTSTEKFAKKIANTSIEQFSGMDNEMEENSIPVSVRVNKKKEIENLVSEKEKVIGREQIELPKMNLTPIEFQEKTDYSVKKAKIKAIGFFGFLAVDYSQIYTHTIETEQPFTGTAASQANLKENNSVLEQEFTRNTYTYREFLKQACYFMKERNFTNAITNFNLILEQFPRDVNAEFYLGYCHYELGNYSKAIAYFEKTQQNGFDFFEEDAQWFIANCFENSGKYKEANKIYREIRKNGGYYSHKVK